MRHAGYHHSEESRKKMSDIAKKRYGPPIVSREDLARLCLVENKSDPKIGALFSVRSHVIERLRGIYGIHRSAAQLAERNGENNRGKKQSLETRMKHSRSITGRKNPHTGKPMSQETKAKLRAAHRGSKNKMWRGGRIVAHGGYVKVFSHYYPTTERGCYVFEHRLAAEGAMGRRLNRHEVVHHINGKRDDNRPENLMTFTSASAHRRFESGHSVKPEAILFDGRLL